MIINGELQNGIGGGVCQVSTTVFNAAFEAGLSIDHRTNHALYIDHYPLSAATRRNTPTRSRLHERHRAVAPAAHVVNAGSLTVNLYGTPPGRRVETETAPLEVDGKVPWKRLDDPTLFKGQKVVEQFGAPPRSTAVTRRVYAPNGTLLYDTTWRSYYVGEPTVVRLGTKPRPKPEPTVPKAGPAEAEAVTPPAAKKPEPTTTAPAATTQP